MICMKTIGVLIIVLLAGSSLRAQVKCVLSVNEKDDFTGRRHKATDFSVVGKLPGLRRLKASIYRIDSVYFLRLTLNDRIGCLNSKSKVVLKLEDDSILTIASNGEIQCGDYVVFEGAFTQYLAVLQQKRIVKLRYQSESYRDIPISEPSFMIDMIRCVN